MSKTYHEYGFDIRLSASVRVRATTPSRAEEILRDFAECFDLGLVADHGNKPNVMFDDETIEFTEASLDGNPDLFEVDEEPV